MSTAAISPQPVALPTPVAVPLSKVVALLITTTLMALAVYYVVGMEQGATSIFGSDSGVHEFVHNARHFLGFPCH